MRPRIKYLIWGVLFGICFPVIGTLIRCYQSEGGFSIAKCLEIQSSDPLLMIIDTAPFFLGLFSYFIGLSIERLLQEQKDRENDSLAYTSRLEIQNSELTELNSALDGLIYTASHDLKTPVVNFKSMISMLRTVKDRPGSEKMVEEILLRMDKSAEKFQVTISDLLNISRIERNFEEPKEEIVIDKAVGEVLESIAEMVNRRESKIHLETKTAPKIMFQPRSMDSILQNLISNALKYSSPERNPEIWIRTSETARNFHLEVEDNGRGIDLEKHKNKIFKMFKRLHTGAEGTGIGLYIIKRIIDKAGGSIQIQSQVNHGTKFLIELPKN
ncbi:MAG: HAMP domain-containing histidine kinase [Bacteroidia bacterium]|nr:HAMP domain-containing histidine kinase [Bacteroidia bacterium]